jgi:hypothetical protein
MSHEGSPVGAPTLGNAGTRSPQLSVVPPCFGHTTMAGVRHQAGEVDTTGRPMDSKPGPTQADPHQVGDVVLLAPKDWADAERALSKLAHVATDRSRTAGSDFSAGPRVTESSLDVTRPPAELNISPLSADRPSRGSRTSRGLPRSLLAACVGVAATLAWQSYGGTAKQMIADSAPQLSWLLLSATNPPSGPESTAEQPSPPAVRAPAPQAASAQAEVVAPTSSETTVPTVTAAPSPELQQLETMARDLAAVRQSVEQLAAGQEQMARDIAKLQTAGQDLRRRISALPPAAAITARKPILPPQFAPQSSAAPLPPAPPQPAPQSSVAPLATAPPQPAPQSSAAPFPPASSEPPLRPPMPVR